MMERRDKTAMKNLNTFALEKVYLWLALPLGLAFLVFNPPFAGVSDEHAHYWKAWSVAEGYWHCTGHDMIPETASLLPDSIKPIKLAGVDGKKIIVAKLRQELFLPDNNRLVNIQGANCPAAPYGYIPSALGLRIGQVAGMSALGSFYLGRLFNLVASILLVWWAIQILPFGKIIFLVVALLPMAVRQFASVSYDALLIAAVMAFVAYILRLASETDKKISRKDTTILLALSLIGLNVKLGYLSLTPLIFLLPQVKFSSVRKYWAYCGAFVTLNVGMFLAVRSFFVDIAVPNWTDPAAQMQFVLHNPLYFLQLVFERVFSESNFFVYIYSVIFKLGSGDGLDWWVYLLVLIGALVLIKSESEKVWLTVRQRWLIFGVFFANFVLVHLALYVGWTSVGAGHITGVQGRYILPIVPVLLLSLYKAPISFRFEWLRKNRNVAILLLSAVIFGAVLMAIYQQFYQKLPKPKSYYDQWLETQQN